MSYIVNNAVNPRLTHIAKGQGWHIIILSRRPPSASTALSKVSGAEERRKGLTPCQYVSKTHIDGIKDLIWSYVFTIRAKESGKKCKNSVEMTTAFDT